MHSRFELAVQQPCTQSWDAMQSQGSDRFCAACAKPVHDVSRMTPSQAELLAMRLDAGESICARLTHRGGELVTLPDSPNRANPARTVVLSAALAGGVPAAAQMATPASQHGAQPESFTVAPSPGPAAEPKEFALPNPPKSDPTRVVLRGHLLRPDGSQVSSGLISMADRNGKNVWYVADELGNFELQPDPGTYDIVVQTGPGQAEHIRNVELYPGLQLFGDLRTQAGQTGIQEEYTAVGGALASTVRWSWHGRFRHPILYLRATARTLKRKCSLRVHSGAE